MPNWKYTNDKQSLSWVDAADQSLGLSYDSGKIELGRVSIHSQNVDFVMVDACFYNNSSSNKILLAYARPQVLFPVSSQPCDPGNKKLSVQFKALVRTTRKFQEYINSSGSLNSLFGEFEISTIGVRENPFGTLKPKPAGLSYRVFETTVAYDPPTSGQGSGHGIRKYSFTAKVHDNTVGDVEFSCQGIKDFTTDAQILCCRILVVPGSAMASLPDGQSYDASATSEITWEVSLGPTTPC